MTAELQKLWERKPDGRIGPTDYCLLFWNAEREDQLRQLNGDLRPVADAFFLAATEFEALSASTSEQTMPSIHGYVTTVEWLRAKAEQYRVAS